MGEMSCVILSVSCIETDNEWVQSTHPLLLLSGLLQPHAFFFLSRMLTCASKLLTCWLRPIVSWKFV